MSGIIPHGSMLYSAGNCWWSSSLHSSAAALAQSVDGFGGCMRRITNLGGGRMRSTDLVLVTSVDGEVV